MAKLPVLITRIDIDAGAERKNYLVQAKQGDKATRFVSVLIVEDGKEYAPPADADLIANFQKPDGKFAYNAAKIDDGNRILVELTNQVLAVPGEVVCEVEIRAKDSSQVLTSCTFTVKVGRSNRNENAILSSNEMTAFDAKWATLNSSMEEYATAERLRAEAEQNRAAAETARQNAETSRDGNETDRKNAEASRASAEESRVTAETARQTAEGKRETNTQAAIKNAQDATNKAAEATKKAEAALADQAELEQTLEDCKALKGQTETAASNAAASKAAAEKAQKQAAAKKASDKSGAQASGQKNGSNAANTAKKREEQKGKTVRVHNTNTAMGKALAAAMGGVSFDNSAETSTKKNAPAVQNASNDAKDISGLEKRIKNKKLLAEELGIGEITLTDILKELEKPGRDPRDDMPKPILRSDVLDMKDLKPGMILKGTVRNVIDFGVFVDIGVHQDGLVHISQITDRYIKHPLEAVSVGDIVDVQVLTVDVAKKRIGLTMKIQKQ